VTWSKQLMELRAAEREACLARNCCSVVEVWGLVLLASEGSLEVFYEAL